VARILIADDHEGTCAILRVLLQDHAEWEICGEASTNSEALQNSITQEIARRLPATAIVLFSFHDLPEMEILAKAAGVHGVASKNLSSLIQAIEKALNSSANRHSAVGNGTTQPALHQSEAVQ